MRARTTVGRGAARDPPTRDRVGSETSVEARFIRFDDVPVWAFSQNPRLFGVRVAGRVFFSRVESSHSGARASDCENENAAESTFYDRAPFYAASAAASPPAANTLAPPARTHTRVGPYGTHHVAGLPGRSGAEGSD